MRAHNACRAPSPAPVPLPRRHHITHRLSCRAIATSMRLASCKRRLKPLQITAGSGRKQGACARAAGVSLGPHPAGSRCGTERAGHVPVLHAASRRQPRFLPTANNGPGAPRQRLSAGQDRSCCFRAAAGSQTGEPRQPCPLPAPAARSTGAALLLRSARGRCH